MAGSGSPQFHVEAPGLRVAIVASRWHEVHIDALLEGARLALAEAKVGEPDVVRVPGSLEIPLACAKITDRYDALVALGVLIRGETPHFTFVSQTITDLIAKISVESGVPIGFGVLQCDDEAQAADRSGLPGARESKGYEAAASAVSMALTLRELG